MTLYTHQSSNIRKTWLLMTGFLVLIILLGWFFSQILRSPAILWFSVALSLVMNVSAYWFSDKVVIAMTGAKETSAKEHPELHRIVENLAITAGLPKPKIYFVNENQPNAFATGRNPQHAVVAVTRGLLERLDRSELEGVLAHELAHIGNRDILLSTVVVVLAGLVAILSDMFLRWSWYGGGRGDRDRDSQANTIIIFIGFAAAILAPLAAMLIRLAISRRREFLADASGALLTRYPEGLARALEKISQNPTLMTSAHNATAHLYFEDPFKGKEKINWLVKLFMTHPSVTDRIKALRGMSI